ncbi:hypothetical protein BN2475_250161 [Paraburkholderia ribeironis]|uniref:Uncharacterized protein n=1 Tax=Paraburkholderia ribeironis TaxID=1247936 RepID=A0A1N7RZ48_9BURK|nr:hypothetical protein BN2475_250161 [Paraburkholderia ribeironis]
MWADFMQGFIDRQHYEILNL